jgi:hypothetical protein
MTDNSTLRQNAAFDCASNHFGLWRCSVFAAPFDPAGIITAVPTRESIADARAYHDLAKLDLAAFARRR